ncbi:UNVERIFIED_CONTAM: hypothetical protein Sradi_0063400 [Sesamum radiatum]|uniref:Uncharacterized protein n=1 Tax=Sesamum radiatum TaxID=300843 RepID=A0AAW2WIM2_SESRA
MTAVLPHLHLSPNPSCYRTITYLNPKRRVGISIQCSDDSSPPNRGFGPKSRNNVSPTKEDATVAKKIPEEVRASLEASNSVDFEILRGLTNSLLAAKRPDEAVQVLLASREHLNKEKSKRNDDETVSTAEKRSDVDPIQVDLLLGKAYSDWGHISDAVSVYDQLISSHLMISGVTWRRENVYTGQSIDVFLSTFYLRATIANILTLLFACLHGTCFNSLILWISCTESGGSLHSEKYTCCKSAYISLKIVSGHSLSCGSIRVLNPEIPNELEARNSWSKEVAFLECQLLYRTEQSILIYYSRCNPNDEQDQKARVFVCIHAADIVTHMRKVVRKVNGGRKMASGAVTKTLES